MSSELREARPNCKEIEIDLLLSAYHDEISLRRWIGDRPPVTLLQITFHPSDQTLGAHRSGAGQHPIAASLRYTFHKCKGAPACIDIEYMRLEGGGMQILKILDVCIDLSMRFSGAPYLERVSCGHMRLEQNRSLPTAAKYSTAFGCGSDGAPEYAVFSAEIPSLPS